MTENSVLLTIQATSDFTYPKPQSEVIFAVRKYIYIYIYIKQVKQESRLTPSKDDHKMRCILEALQVQIYKSKK